jgi:hypothetical protein
MLGRRSLRQQGGWLALAAFALQFVLSFGHIHAKEIFTGGQGSLTISVDRHPGPSQEPFDDVAAEGACAICAAMALAGTSLLPDPVEVPLPSVVAAASEGLADRHVARVSPFRLFQSRAPPSV